MTATTVKRNPAFELAAALLPALIIAAALAAGCSESRQNTDSDASIDVGETVYAITNVNVVPMDSERILEDQTVIIQGKRVSAIGSSDKLRVPDGATIVDGRGKYLMPGLFDMHVHIFSEGDLTLYLANGVTTIRNLWGWGRHLSMRENIESGELLGPRLFTSGFYATQPLINTPEEAEELVADHKAVGFDCIKVYGRIPLEAYKKLVSAAVEQDIRVVGHAPRNLPFTAVLDAGQNSLDHMEEIVHTHVPIVELMDSFNGNAEELPDLPSELSEEITALARQVKESGLWITPALIAYDLIWRQVTDEYFELMQKAEIKYLDPFSRVYWGPKFNKYRRQWAQELDQREILLRKSLELQKAMVKEFHSAGVPLLLGTDANNPISVPGFSIHQELALMVESGLSPYEALRTGTANPARYLGIDNDAGTVAAGKRADLILLEANPLKDVANASRISGVFVAGKWLPGARLETMLTNLAELNVPLEQPISDLMSSIMGGDFSETLGAITEGNDIQPGIKQAVERVFDIIGHDMLQRMETDGAIQIFKLMTENFPESANAYVSLAEAFSQNGDKAKAIDLYTRALEIDPDLVSVKQMLEHIQKQDK